MPENSNPEMDKAAAKAESVLRKNIANWTGYQVAQWWANPEYGYTKSGHKRLGRILAALAPPNSKSKKNEE